MLIVFIFSKIFFALCALRTKYLAANKKFNAANSALIRQTPPSAVLRITIARLTKKKCKQSSEISIIVERRGKKEDHKLLNYYNGLRNRGTKWVTADRLRARICDFSFKNKKDNVIGLQIADLIAYPITIHLLYPERSNRSYEVVRHNIFQDNGVLLGQKVIPH